MKLHEVEKIRNNKFYNWLGKNPVMPDMEFYSLEPFWKEHMSIENERKSIFKPHFCGHMYKIHDTGIIKR